MNKKIFLSLGIFAACSMASHAATTIANESGNFSLAASTTVAYGPSGALPDKFVSKLLTAGSYTCGNDLFGDPSPGVLKSCSVESAAPLPSSTPTTLATESKSFALSTATAVTYGADGKTVSKFLAAGSYVCGNALFGDPIVGVAKTCTTTTNATTLAREFSNFTLTTATTVTYGANGKTVSRLLAAGTYMCGNGLFGDPIAGVAKTCTGTTAATTLAREYASFTLTTATIVTYGANGQTVSKLLAAGTYVCGNALFGDPIDGAAKSCTTDSAAPPAPPPLGALKVVELATGLSSPWSLAFLPNGQMLVTQRQGQLRLRNGDGSAVNGGNDQVCCVPTVDAEGQGGLLDVAIDPSFATNRRIYFTFAERIGTANGVAVGRAELDVASRTLANVAVIYRQEPKVTNTGLHYGSRLAFDRNGYLFVTMGERSIPEQRGFAQALDRGNGKVVRITTDGVAAPANPFIATAGAQQAIWSYGHRNPQGAAVRPGTNQLWVSEHGPQGGDEINLALPGRNYGWPVISYGQEYGTTSQFGEGTAKAGMEQPAAYWEKIDGSAWTGGQKSSIAPSNIAFYTSDRLAGWQGNLFVGALAGTALWRLVLDGDRVVQRERLLADRGERIRDVRQGPDGWLYLLTDNGKLLRLER